MTFLQKCVAATVALAGLAAGPATAATFTDGFDTNVIDTTWWNIGADGGSTVVATNQRVELTQGASGATGLSFKTPISGDFTARIDFALLNWPNDNKERLALGGFFSPTQQLQIQRTSDSTVGVGTEIYVTDFTGQGILGTPTTDTSGTLRLERIGDVVTGAYLTPTGWNVIGTYTAAGENSLARTIGFAIFPGTPVTSGVKVAIDNVYLSGPNVPIPEPATIVMLMCGLGLLAIVHGRARRTRARVALR